MKFSSDAMADFEGLLEVNRKICKQQMAQLQSTLDMLDYKEGTKTITFAELQEAVSNKNGSDLDCLAAP